MDNAVPQSSERPTKHFFLRDIGVWNIVAFVVILFALIFSLNYFHVINIAQISPSLSVFPQQKPGQLSNGTDVQTQRIQQLIQSNFLPTSIPTYQTSPDKIIKNMTITNTFWTITHPGDTASISAYFSFASSKDTNPASYISIADIFPSTNGSLNAQNPESVGEKYLTSSFFHQAKWNCIQSPLINCTQIYKTDKGTYKTGILYIYNNPNIPQLVKTDRVIIVSCYLPTTAFSQIIDNECKFTQ